MKPFRTNMIFLTAIFFALAIPAQAEKSRPPSLASAEYSASGELESAVKKFKAACEQLLLKDKKVKNPATRCACVGENLSAKVNAGELALLTKVYEGNEAAENELEEKAPLQDMELEISQNCLANVKWKMAVSEEEPLED